MLNVGLNVGGGNSKGQLEIILINIFMIFSSKKLFIANKSLHFIIKVIRIPKILISS